MTKNLFKGNFNLCKSILWLAVPIIIGQLGAIVTGLADTIMVGQHSTDELAAASFVNNVINAFIILGTGFSYNLTPLVGQNLANNKRKMIGGWLKNSLIANLSTTLIIMGLLCLIYFNLPLLRQPEHLLPLIRPYFVVSMTSVVFVMMYNTFRQFIEGITDASISMYVLTFGNLLNIIGNYILIYGKLGMPELGLLGAGISTLVSRIVMLLSFVVIFLVLPKYKAYRQGFSVLPFKIEYWKKLNVLGWPIALQQGIEAATFCITTIMVGWLGGIELAAHQVAVAISTVSFTMYLGLGAAVAIRSSFFKGMNDWENVKRTIISGIYICIGVAAVASVVLLLYKDSVGQIFTTDSVVSYTVSLLIPILIAYQFGDSIQIILANALRGLSDVKVIMWVSLVAYFAVALPCGYLIAFTAGIGITGIWLTYPIGFTVSVLLLGNHTWKYLKRFDHSRTDV